VVLGFGKKRDDYEDDDDEPIELVLFQGAVNGKDANLAANARLVQAGLVRTKELIGDALSRRSEMIRIEPKGKASVATFFVDGIPYPGSRMPPQAGLAITQMVKLLAGLDIQVRDKPQSGGIKAEFQEQPYVLRVNVFPMQGGAERLIVRADNQKTQLYTPEDLGFSEQVKTRIREIAAEKTGFLLAAGPPMSGVTTGAFAMVRGIDSYLYTVYNLADVEGRDLGHVTTFKTNPDDTLQFSINRARRAEADVLYIDPIRDAETCRMLAEEAEDLCIISELRAADAAAGIVQIREWLGDAELTAERVRAVLSQKLIRLVCRKCRQAYRPNPKLLAKVGLPPETKVLYRPPPADDGDEDVCRRCGGVGFFGRTGMVEFLEMTDGMKQVVISGGDAAAIRLQARREKMQSFHSDGLRLVAEGKTSLDELQRVFRGK